jgi:hypothetical protein
VLFRSCKKFSDVRRLASALWPIAKKFHLFGESGNVGDHLTRFKANYEVVYTALTLALKAIQDPPSKLATIQAELDAANARIGQAIALGAAFYKHSPAERPDCGNCDYYRRNGGYTACQQCQKSFSRTEDD